MSAISFNLKPMKMELGIERAIRHLEAKENDCNFRQSNFDLHQLCWEKERCCSVFVEFKCGDVNSQVCCLLLTQETSR